MCNRFHTLNDFLDHLRWVLDQKEQKESESYTSDYYLTCCPVHGGKNSDLKIEEIDHKVFLHCFAGCEQKYILDALDLRPEDLFLGYSEFGYPIVKAVSVIYGFNDDEGDLSAEVVWYKPVRERHGKQHC